MALLILQEIGYPERRAQLEQMATRREERTYSRSLSREEIETY